MYSFSTICLGRFFTVPPNQRGYSWRIKEVEAVFSDLELAGANSHYLGSVIVSRTDSPDFQDETLTTTSEFYLEDGQQRLTTFFLIADTLRKILDKSADPEVKLEAKELDRLLFYKRGGSLHLRIQNKNPELHQMLRHLIEGCPSPSRITPPMVRLREAKEYIEGYVTGFAIEVVRKWKQRICNQAKFIWIDLKSEGIERYLAFDAINSRGLPLSEFDKIKNFCILVSTKHGLNINPEDKWFDAIEALQKFEVGSRSKESSFTSILYSVYFGTRISESEVHSEIVNRFKPLLTKRGVSLESEVVDFISYWPTFANSYGLLATEVERDGFVTEGLLTADARNWLLRLDQLELPGVCRPILLAAHIKLNQVDFATIARACEIYTFRTHAVAGRRKDSRAAEIVALASRVFHNEVDARGVLVQICEWLHEDPDTRLSAMLKELTNGRAKYYYDSDVKGWQYCYYFLYEYELSNSPLGISPLPWRNERNQRINTIEHILPQSRVTPPEQWENEWPDAAKAAAYKHRLGNLVLTANNSALGRKWISDKLNSAGYCYQSPNATNGEKRISHFTDGSHWSSTDILTRELEMMHFAAIRWSLPCKADAGIVSLTPIEGAPDGWKSFEIEYPQTEPVDIEPPEGPEDDSQI